MRVACLQLSAKLGKVEDNIARANALLEESSVSNLDLLILPELAFTGTFFSQDMTLDSIDRRLPRLQFPLPRSDNTVPGAHRYRCIFSMGQDNCSATSMYRHCRLP